METINLKSKKNSKGVILINTGFGNRCCIDGSFFDDGGICSYGHQAGGLYIGQVLEESKKPSEKKNLSDIKDPQHIKCEVFSGVRCNICGGLFDETDDICSLGGHQIGAIYKKTG